MRANSEEQTKKLPLNDYPLSPILRISPSNLAFISVSTITSDPKVSAIAGENVLYREGEYQSRDGLALFYRDFGRANPSHSTLLCLPGLTRNSKDFIALAERYGNRRRVLCPDLRGRGRSDYDPKLENYHPNTYVEDMWDLLELTNTSQVVVIGTSLGGLMAMLMAATRPQAVRGVVLNDVGPEVISTGLERICGYVGNLPPVYRWYEALNQSKMVYEMALPHLSEREWLEFTKRQYREEEGRIILEYDPAIGEALRKVGGIPLDPWTLFRALTDIPTLATRGELSDILSQATLDQMQEVKPDLIRVLVRHRGHVPLLNEPECIAALDAFLHRI